MKPTKSKRLIAVDSETGLCWYEDSVLQVNGLAKALVVQNKTDELEHRAEQLMLSASGGLMATV